MTPAEVFATVFSLLALAMTSASIVIWVRLATRVANRKRLVELTSREGVPWSIDGIIVGFGLMILVTTTLAQLASRTGWVSLSSSDELSLASLSNRSNLLLLEGAARVIAIALLCMWFIRIYRASSIDLGFKITGSSLRVGLIATVAILPPIYLLQAALNYWIEYEHPVLNLLQETGDLTFFIPMTIVAVLVAPITEEFVFRVVLQGWLESAGSPSVAPSDASDETPIVTEPAVPYWPILVSSVLFAAMHTGQGPAPITLFFLALGLGYLYRQTHSIWPSLIVHFTLNAITMAVAALSIAYGDSLAN